MLHVAIDSGSTWHRVCVYVCMCVCVCMLVECQERWLFLRKVQDSMYMSTTSEKLIKTACNMLVCFACAHHYIHKQAAHNTNKWLSCQTQVRWCKCSHGLRTPTRISLANLCIHVHKYFKIASMSWKLPPVPSHTGKRIFPHSQAYIHHSRILQPDTHAPSFQQYCIPANAAGRPNFAAQWYPQCDAERREHTWPANHANVTSCCQYACMCAMLWVCMYVYLFSR